LKHLVLATIPLLAMAGPATAQNTAGAGGGGGNAVVNIYGGNIYLAPKGGEGGAGGSIRGGGSPSGPIPQGSGPVTGGGPSLWNHNGSTMRLEAAGARRRFVYDQPRPGMRAVGATPGTLLFDGTRRGDSYAGVAYVFAGECGRFPYDVTGRLASETEVVMSGMAPTVSRATCAIEGYRQDRLVFGYLGAR
jgi:hypothetical protein